jgi:outer membrane protein OmpA-like peptidoglycan-associated protein
VRFSQVIQGDDAVDSSDARIVLFGLELGLFDGRPKAAVAQAKAKVGPGDRDHDDIPDEDDACPDVAEDKDGFEDTDGCPDTDNDKDTILDADDRCPNEAEDADGYDDTDGCPDPDNDDDEILDADDQCPTEAEVVNGVDDADGCPDEGLIHMVDDRIVLEETVLFDFERARIKSSAKPILRAIVNLWKQHEGEWVRFRIEGHSDPRGDKDFNDDLSWRRAQHVRDALVAEGLPMRIMDAQGFGSSKLRDLGTTERAHQRNRRVEFVVSAKVAKGAPTAGAPAPMAPAATEGTPAVVAPKEMP